MKRVLVFFFSWASVLCLFLHTEYYSVACNLFRADLGNKGVASYCYRYSLDLTYIYMRVLKAIYSNCWRRLPKAICACISGESIIYQSLVEIWNQQTLYVIARLLTCLHRKFLFSSGFEYSKSSHDRFLRKCLKLLALKNSPIYQMLIDAIFPLWNIWVKVRYKVSFFSRKNSTRLLNLLSYCHQSWFRFHCS